jgi:hypothetical protein
MSRPKDFLAPDAVARRELEVDLIPLDDPTPSGVKDVDALPIRIATVAVVLIVLAFFMVVAGIADESQTMVWVGVGCAVPLAVILVSLSGMLVWEFINWVATGQKGDNE